MLFQPVNRKLSPEQNGGVSSIAPLVSQPRRTINFGRFDCGYDRLILEGLASVGLSRYAFRVDLIVRDLIDRYDLTHGHAVSHDVARSEAAAICLWHCLQTPKEEMAFGRDAECKLAGQLTNDHAFQLMMNAEGPGNGRLFIDTVIEKLTPEQAERVLEKFVVRGVDRHPLESQVIYALEQKARPEGVARVQQKMEEREKRSIETDMHEKYGC